MADEDQQAEQARLREENEQLRAQLLAITPTTTTLVTPTSGSIGGRSVESDLFVNALS